MNKIKSVAGAFLLFTVLSTAAMADEIKSLAILTPETGTDFGWNQRGIESAIAAGEATGVKVDVVQNLGYGDLRPILRELVEEGYDLLIGHASGFNTATLEIGAESGTKVLVVDSPGALRAGAAVDYTASGHEGAFIAGHLAAMKTRSGTIGIVVSGDTPSWNSQSTAFAQGALREKPDIIIRYVQIGPASYSDAAGGRRVTEALIATGADVIFGQGNGSSFGMLQATETVPAVDGGDVYFIDNIGDKSSIDTGHLLSSVLWDYTPIYKQVIEDIRGGIFGTRRFNISLADNSVTLLRTPLISDEEWEKLMDLRQKIVDGEISVEPKFDVETVLSLVKRVN